MYANSFIFNVLMHVESPGLLSAQAQSIAASGSTYGYDVLVRIGWLRYQARATYKEIHRELVSQVRISESHIRYLYQHLYLPLLACHERQHRDHLAQVAELQGDLMIALDGLAPQAGEPQIWFIRELTSGLTLRSGWLCKQDQPTFEAFLRPLKQLEWPVLAVLSDKQTGLMPAVRTVGIVSRPSLSLQRHLIFWHLSRDGKSSEQFVWRNLVYR